MKMRITALATDEAEVSGKAPTAYIDKIFMSLLDLNAKRILTWIDRLLQNQQLQFNLKSPLPFLTGLPPQLLLGLSKGCRPIQTYHSQNNRRKWL